MTSHSRIDVSIIVVSYNTRDLTDTALTSILAETKSTSYEVIVVDNGSSDGSPGMIAAHAVKPRLFARRDNLGFARANNLAAASARGDYLLLLNPDTVVLEGAIDRLMAFAKHRPDARIWGGRTLFADGALNPASCWNRATVWSLFCRATGLSAVFPKSRYFDTEAIGGWSRDTVRSVDIVAGCFFLIETSLWRELDGFDPLFFMYGEEADLCLRAEKRGARPAITPSATIIHYGGASERVRADKMVRLLAAKASLITRHWRPSLAPLGRALLAAWPASRAVATTLATMASISPAAIESANTWRQIWRRRHEWISGYGDGDRRAPMPASVSSRIQKTAA